MVRITPSFEPKIACGVNSAPTPSRLRLSVSKL
jgi:hypothetical protein